MIRKPKIVKVYEKGETTVLIGNFEVHYRTSSMGNEKLMIFPIIYKSHILETRPTQIKEVSKNSSGEPVVLNDYTHIYLLKKKREYVT